MSSSGPLKHFLIAFVIALVLYAVSYTAIEHRRTRQGPWEVVFSQEPGGVPTLIVNQPKLNLANVKITFPRESSAPTNVAASYSQPQPVPYAVPFGQCLFMDTTFQPGTMVFNLFGHEVQLIPRVLTIDRKEFPWQSGATFAVTNTPLLTNSALLRTGH